MRDQASRFIVSVACAIVALSLTSCATTVFYPVIPDADLTGFDFSAFGPNFMWGAASSAHQVEGNDIHSDWWVWENSGRTKSGEVSGMAVDHWNRFEEDMDLLESLNLDSYRFSLNWARLFPTDPDTLDEQAAKRYDAFFQSLAARGIRPMVTLHHFMMPQWLTAEDRWATGAAVDDFRKFSEFAAGRWGRYVDWWITMNEPEVYAFNGWGIGIYPPGKQDVGAVFDVLGNFMRAHAESYHAIKSHDDQDADGDGIAANVGVAHLMIPFEPSSILNPIDNLCATVLGNFVNVFWLEANRTGILRPAIPFISSIQEYPKFVDTLDFIGVNYYSREVVAMDHEGFRIGAPPNATLNELGIELFPPGLSQALQVVARYDLPIVITENGIPDADDNDRSRFIVAHLSELARFMRTRPDIEILGYIHWSLTDNFEWEHGFKPRFGLFEVEYPSLNRTKRPSADVLRAIVTGAKNAPVDPTP